MTFSGMGFANFKAWVKSLIYDGGGVLKSYPIGAIYTSTVATSPADLFGGTWEALPEGRVLLAQGTSYPAGQEGGEATHEITTDEMPSHTHTGSTGSAGDHEHGVQHYSAPDKWTGNCCSMTLTSGSNGFLACLDVSQDTYSSGKQWLSKSTHSRNTVNYSRLTEAGSHSHTFTTDATGGKEDGTTQPMSLMQPYLSVYMWRRTA